MSYEFDAPRENAFRKYAGRTSLLKRDKQQIITEERNSENCEILKVLSSVFLPLIAKQGALVVVH